MFRALSYKNFRLFFVGQGISLVGTWMQQIAVSWLVYRLTGSAFMLGLTGFCTQIPTFIFSPFAGVLIDRYSRHRIIILTQILSMLQAFILASLTLAGIVKVWHVILLGFFLGCINSMDTPARQSFVINMVEKKEFLGNAIALNSSMFNLARLIGPSIAGVCIVIFGEGICFGINGISFIAVICCLLAMKIDINKQKVKHPHILKGFKDGFIYTFGFVPIRYILILLGVISLMGMSYATLMPVFAKEILRGGPRTLGFLMGAVGVGALFGTVYLASRKNIIKLSGIIPVASCIFGAGLIAFSLSRSFWLSLVILLFTGCGFMIHMASSNTVLQTIVDEDKRGRVMSFYTMAFLGMAPMGSLLAGVLAGNIGVRNALAISGASCITASVIFALKIPVLKKIVHPIYGSIDTVAELSVKEGF